MMTLDEHRNLLRDVDERALPRRQGESAADYGKRMREYLNPRPTPSVTSPERSGEPSNNS